MTKNEYIQLSLFCWDVAAKLTDTFRMEKMKDQARAYAWLAHPEGT